MIGVAYQHISVLLHEVIDALTPRKDGVYIDGTFGRGGYSRGLLESGAAHVFGIDRDPEAVKVGVALTRDYPDRFTVLHGPFGAMDILLAGTGVAQVDGITLDLGVSSPQIDDAIRGFSFMADGPLDMRMSQSGPTAAEIVNTMAEKELADTIYLYGEERHSRRIARRIAEARAEDPITRTTQLANLIRSSVPRSNDGIDPATRTFQALRIYVNDEMGELHRGLRAAERLLKPAGRLAVVSFHSLEDRIVKQFMQHRSALSANPSRHIPANDDAPEPSFTLITRKPITPSDDECARNPRARSAKLRVAERTTALPFPVKENAA